MPVHDWTTVPANLFHDFHSAWLAEIRKALNHDVLPDEYLALLERSAGKAVPDVITLHQPMPVPNFEPTGEGPEAVAVAEKPPQADLVTMKTSPSFALRQKRIVVRHTSGDVVAVIELVSPGNKHSAEAVEKFCEKIAFAIMQRVHALVLDLPPPR